MFEYKVYTDNDRCRNYLSPMEPAYVTQHGLLDEMIVGERIGNSPLYTPSMFRPNPAYLDFLYWVIAVHAVFHRPLIQAAQKQQDGHLYLLDQRGDGQLQDKDIISRLTVAQGEIRQVQRNKIYQVFTENGLTQPEDWLQTKHREELAKLHTRQQTNCVKAAHCQSAPTAAAFANE